MRRRTLIVGAVTLAAMPDAAVAQRRPRPLIGYLGAGTAPSWKLWTENFIRRLGELGRIEGRTIDIEYRWGNGSEALFHQHAADLAARRVDVIVTGGGAVPAVQKATRDIPIVFAVANDPVGAGYVASLARPGGNVTGLALQAQDLVGKRLELLREVAPRARRLGMLVNVTNRGAQLDLEEATRLAPQVNFETQPIEVRDAEEIWRAFDGLPARIDAIYLCRDALLNAHEVRIAELALAARLPCMFLNREVVRGGGLIAYGPYLPDLFRRAAEIVDKVLRGTPPAEIPVEQPTRFELAINLNTAKALGIEVPPMLLTRADEVIE